MGRGCGCEQRKVSDLGACPDECKGQYNSCSFLGASVQARTRKRRRLSSGEDDIYKGNDTIHMSAGNGGATWRHSWEGWKRDPYSVERP